MSCTQEGKEVILTSADIKKSGVKIFGKIEKLVSIVIGKCHISACSKCTWALHCIRSHCYVVGKCNNLAGVHYLKSLCTYVLYLLHAITISC